MDIAALVLGIVALILAIIPSFSITQAAGGLLSIVALVLAVLARRRLIYKHQSRGVATAGLVLGIAGLLFNGAIFASCQYCQHRVGQKVRESLESGKLERELDHAAQQLEEELDIPRHRKALEDELRGQSPEAAEPVAPSPPGPR